MTHAAVPAPASNRPRPIKRAFTSVGGAITAVGTIVNALVSLGVITAAQGTSVEGLAAAVPGFIQLVVMSLAAFGVLKRSEAETTSTADPSTTVNGRLVRLVPDGDQYDQAVRQPA